VSPLFAKLLLYFVFRAGPVNSSDDIVRVDYEAREGH